MDGTYHFGCTVSFECPICGRTSSEKRVYEAGTPDPKRIAAVVSRQVLDCQLCGAALTRRTRLEIKILPGTLEQLRNRGFAVRLAG